MIREIIIIDEEKCTGCGLCIPNCPEGALQIIDGKARLISDLFCDGLGACIGHCPEGAISIEKREAEEYDEKRVMENVVRQGSNVIRAHLEHLKNHGQDEFLGQAMEFLKEKGIDIPMPFGGAAPCDIAQEKKAAFSGCPGARVMDFGEREKPGAVGGEASKPASSLRQWPVLLMLVPPQAPFLKGSDLLIAADCVPFAYAGFHEDLLKGRVLLVGCPKFDDIELYKEKLISIFTIGDIRSVTVAHMEVPCCFGLVRLVRQALEASGKSIPFEDVEIGITGERK